MTEKIEKRQDQQPKPDKKKARKFPKMTKKVLITACVCGGLTLGAGGIAGIAAMDCVTQFSGERNSRQLLRIVAAVTK